MSERELNKKDETGGAFTATLGFGRQWRVAESRFEGELKRLELRFEYVPGEHFECTGVKASCGVHDTI